MGVGPFTPGGAETARILFDVIFGLGEDFEAALFDFLVGHAHHRAGGIATAHGIGAGDGVAERCHGVVTLPFQTVLFQYRHGDHGVTGGDRIGCQNFAFEILIVVDARRDDEFLVDALTAAEKNHEIVFLRIFALALGPGDDVVGVIQY